MVEEDSENFSHLLRCGIDIRNSEFKESAKSRNQVEITRTSPSACERISSNTNENCSATSSEEKPIFF